VTGAGDAFAAGCLLARAAGANPVHLGLGSSPPGRLPGGGRPEYP
jgi:hypothetical protein